MIYANLIYLLVVIFVLTTNSIPDTPQFSFINGFSLFVIKAFFFNLLVRFVFRPGRVRDSAHYFTLEQKLSILAIITLALDVYLLDSQYFFSRLPLVGRLPTLIDLGGICLFFFYLTIIWAGARQSYGFIFNRIYSRREFILSNIKSNLPIVLPWLLLSLFADLLQLLPFPGLQRLLASAWGEPLVFLAFFFVLALTFPVIIVRLWNCKPLEPGPLRDHLETFCRKHKIGYADIMIWPLFEGRVITAGVMGMVKPFRYLLLTPALLSALNPAEIDAVMAHEIGHVRKYHLQLYIFLFLGFGLLAQLANYPTLYLLLNSAFFYKFCELIGQEPGTVLNFLSTLPMFVLMLIYFRFIFGFFMRNFERQADLYSLISQGTGYPLVQSLEKIALLSGNIRDQPNWHHFGIGERVEFLQQCERDPRVGQRHERKVYTSLAIYFVIICIAAFSVWKMPADLLEGAPREKFAEAVIKEKIKKDERNPLWYQLLGDLQQGRRLYNEAIAAYEKNLALTPDDPDVLNNLAWLLVSADDIRARNPARALMLARRAAELKPAGHILDTLATAYWANGFRENSLRVEKQAIEADPLKKEFYEQQLKKFAESDYPAIPD